MAIRVAKNKFYQYFPITQFFKYEPRKITLKIFRAKKEYFLALLSFECQEAYKDCVDAQCAGHRKNSQMKFRPLHDRVVIRRAEGDIKSKGGIIIPDNAKEKPQEGEVIAVGPGSRDESGKLIPPDVAAGDMVLFGKWSGTEVRINGEDLLIMKEADIMGVVETSATAKKAA